MRKFLVTADQAVESVIEGILAVSRVPLERVQGHFGLIYRGNRHRRVHIVVGGGSGHEPLFLGAVGPGMADGAIAGAVFAAPNPFSIQATAEALGPSEGTIFLYRQSACSLVSVAPPLSANGSEQLKILVRHQSRCSWNPSPQRPKNAPAKINNFQLEPNHPNKKYMKNIRPPKFRLALRSHLTIAVTTVALSYCLPLAFGESDSGKKKDYKFVIVPKVVHPWFDQVNEGAKKAAKMIEDQTGSKVSIDYRAPQSADVVVQNEILERSIANKPDGIALDLLDGEGNRAVIEEALKRKIPVVVFDSEPPPGLALTSVGGDFAAQARIAGERLAEILGKEGEVAIMQGVPTAPNHRIRAETYREVFKKYPKMKLVAEGIDNDDIETAQKEAAAVMSAHPNLRGWVECDAAGPIGVGIAIKEANKSGTVKSVGLDDLNQLIDLIKEGVVDSSSASRPQMQGYWSVIALWQQSLGVPTPQKIDTGAKFITQEMAKDYNGL